MSKPWDKPTARREALLPRQRHLIVSEDAKSGLDYLRAFEVPAGLVEIQTEGGAGNTVSVVERALELREKALQTRRPFAHVWCVIDRDEHPLDRYQRAFTAAANFNDVSVIWANECFELWYLLHFCYRDTAIGRADLRRELGRPERLDRAYDKADPGIFLLLKDRLPMAIQHAERLSRSNSSAHDNPSTNIHVLVRKLIQLQQQG